MGLGKTGCQLPGMSTHCVGRGHTNAALTTPTYPAPDSTLDMRTIPQPFLHSQSLLGQYAGSGDAAGLPGIVEGGIAGGAPAPGERAAIEQASALLGRLVEQPPSLDSGEPNPNQILTPRSLPVARDHRLGTGAAPGAGADVGIFGAGAGVGAGAGGKGAGTGAGINKLRPYLQVGGAWGVMGGGSVCEFGYGERAVRLSDGDAPYGGVAVWRCGR